jgi:hypothetical protein
VSSDHSRPAGPYASARDLPSFVELQQQLRGGKALTRWVGRKLRSQLVDLEAQLDRLAKIVDGFYALLGERNWVFHDSLNFENVASIVESGAEADEAERRFLSLYQEPETLGFMAGQLSRHEPLRRRRHLIDRAREDFAASRYDAVVLLLLTVMDGFVNDIDTARRGLHARDVDDMQAWDTVVGHHLGLAHAHKSFTKSIKKTVEDECFELHRHGLVHGMILNYNNVIIATKAWNRLFAVADWATGREKQQVPPEPKPTWRGIVGQLATTAQMKNVLETWRPRDVAPEDGGYADEPVYRQSLAYLTAWQQKNYGRMGESLPKSLAEDTPNKTAGRVREEVEIFRLSDFAIGTLHFVAAAVCEVDVTLRLNDEQKAGRLRWILEAPDGSASTLNASDVWRLYLWGPMAIINRASAGNADEDSHDDE